MNQQRSTRAVLFDLGGTLARYYERHDFPAILEQAVGNAGACLERHGSVIPPTEALRHRTELENFEARNHRVRPLERRLSRIFGLRGTEDCIPKMCREFMRPIFALGARYQDTLPFLKRLRQSGIRTAIVSNTPWGSPADLWREEVKRLGLHDLMDEIVFCRDAGWRKPARPVFMLALHRLGVTPEQCLFIGDHPRWDVRGPRAVGMDVLLIDRLGTRDVTGVTVIGELGGIRC